MNQNTFYSIADAARLLGVQEHKINYLYRARKLPEPVQFAGRRLYRWPDIQRLAKHFGVELHEEGQPCTQP